MTTALRSPPAVVCEPPGRAGSYVDDVAEVAERIGRPLIPEQLFAVDVLQAHDRRGRLLSVEAGIEMPRQNGKTGAIVLPCELWECLTSRGTERLWTAHMADTTVKSFHELVGKTDDDESALINQHEWLRRRVRGVVRTHGNEALLFKNGSSLGFRCRSTGRGRGLSGEAMTLDEALFLTAAEAGALLPVLATRSLHGNARATFASSAAKAESLFLRTLRARAVLGDPTLTYVGWWAKGSWSDPGCLEDDCAHDVGTPGCSLDNEDLWFQSNPLLGVMTSVEFLRGQRKQQTPLEFGREFLGWEDVTADAVDLARWGRLADPHSTPLPRPIGLGLAVSPKGKSAAVVAAGRREDGLAHVEILEQRPGTSWLPAWLLAKQREIGWEPVHYVGGTNPTATVLPDLESEGCRMEKLTLGQFAAGCDALDQLVRAGTIRHRGHPDLTASLMAVARRDAGDGAWVMTWRGAMGDGAAAMAAAVAVHALAGAPSDYDLSASVV